VLLSAQTQVNLMVGYITKLYKVVLKLHANDPDAVKELGVIKGLKSVKEPKVDPNADYGSELEADDYGGGD
jgi:hypothetical protein